jgi:hypothetical protein
MNDCKLKYLFAFLALGAFSVPVWSQEVSPQPAGPTDELRLTMTLDAVACFNRLEDVQVDVDSMPIVVNYVVEPVPNPICPVPPPLRMDVALGSFEPGSYELVIDGTIDGEAQPTATASFEVLGAGSTQSVPTISDVGLLLLSSLVFLFGMARFRG